MSYVHRCMIVPAAQQALAKEMVVLLAGEPAAGMFVTGLSPSGEEPFTHYISSGAIEEQFAEVLANGTLMSSLALAAGKVITPLACGVLLAACDITDDDPFVALDRLGLKLLTDEQRQALQAARDEAAKLEAATRV